jgi:FixJ family two-component response regulator
MSRTGLISIVDDDHSVREGLTDLLNSMGFETATYPSAEDFLACDDIARALCLITDGNLTGMTGLELHRQLRASGRQIPTILITAFPTRADRVQALREGMFCYLSKPFSDTDLLACLHSAIAFQEKAGLL